MRDVADLIVAALDAPEPRGRLVFGGELVDMASLRQLLQRISGRDIRSYPLGGRAMRGLGRVNDLIMRVTSADFVLTGEGMQYLTRYAGSDDRAALDLLGRPPRDVEDVLTETVRWMLERGQLDPELAPRLA